MANAMSKLAIAIAMLVLSPFLVCIAIAMEVDDDGNDGYKYSNWPD